MRGSASGRRPARRRSVVEHAVQGSDHDLRAIPALRADSEAAGAVVALSSSPAEFTPFIEAETRKLGKIVKAANLSADK